MALYIVASTVPTPEPVECLYQVRHYRIYQDRRVVLMANEVRKCFGPRKGYTWYLFDYSQMEMVYFCLLAGAWEMVDAYMKGADVHTEMTRRVLGKKAFGKDGKVIKNKRDEIKHLNFAVLYGMGIAAVAEKLRVNITKADEVMSMYLGKIPEIITFRNQCNKLVYSQGYVDCMFGKRYSADRTNAYKMVNKRIQGGCAQILKIAILQILDLMGTAACFGVKIVLPIHDELIFERRNANPVHEDVFITAVKKAMENIPDLLKLGLKLRVDVSKTTTNWANKEKIECES